MKPPAPFACAPRKSEVTLQRRGVLVRVRRLDGSPLMTDLSEPRPLAGAITWERQMLDAVRFYGLGPRTDPAFDLRGKSIETADPFLYCTVGYAESHAASGPHRFDFTRPGRFRITAPAVDYFFYYGPSVKEVFTQHHQVAASRPHGASTPTPRHLGDAPLRAPAPGARRPVRHADPIVACAPTPTPRPTSSAAPGNWDPWSPMSYPAASASATSAANSKPSTTSTPRSSRTRATRYGTPSPSSSPTISKAPAMPMNSCSAMKC